MKTFVICLIIGLIVGGIVIGILFSQLRSVVAKDTAHDYVTKGSFRLVEQNDVFLGKKLDKRPRQKPQPNNQS